MEGFFYKREEKKRRNSGPKKEIDLCEKCGLYKNCESPKMKPTGEGKKKILVIAEAPGRVEDEKGIQLIGRSGQLFREVLQEYGLDLEADCWKTNAIICRPPNNKTPTTSQINHCRNNLLKTIDELKPEKIITLGKTALHSLIGNKVSVTSMEKWLGWKIPDQDYKCWIYPIYHPAYILRNQGDDITLKYFIKYIEEAINHNIEFKEIDLNNLPIGIMQDEKNILDLLNTIKEGDCISFDFEATGLKPHKEGHKIICMSIATDKMTIAFPILDSIKNKIKDILENVQIKKIAHNLRYEHLWSQICLNTSVEGWCFDTMIGTHILDNRPGITGLKFQIYVNYGIVGYDNTISEYILSPDKSNNSFNRIEECPFPDLLKYCGVDSYFTHLLFKEQKKKLSAFTNKGMDLFMNGIIELSKVQLNGIHFDKQEYIEKNKKLENEMNSLERRIQNSKEVKKLESEKEFNFKSNKQLRYLLYDVLDWKVEKETAGGLQSTDKETLEKLNKTFTNNILRHRYLKKIKDTYLAQFEREAVKRGEEYIIYPNFNLNTVRTYRSSSSNPNFQNVPIRDKYASDIVRGVLIPRKNNKIMEVDYSSIEVRISTCYHYDPVMIEYIKNPENDMHRDLAEQIFEVNSTHEKFKEFKLRYLAKNRFVFPQFYGDYWKSCTFNLWEGLSKDQREELNLKDYYKFESHIEDVEYDFWNRRFKVYNEWKEETYKKYLSSGFVRLKTGFICKGVMNKKEVINYPIQGTAFHCLLWSLIQINRLLTYNNYNTMIIGQIHDSIVFDLDPAEQNDLIPIIKNIMCLKIKKEWEWINIPLEVEYEATDINESWALKKEL